MTLSKHLFQKHRVVLPEDEVSKRRARRCNAFFMAADHDCVVRCVYGSDNYTSPSVWSTTST